MLTIIYKNTSQYFPVLFFPCLLYYTHFGFLAVLLTQHFSFLLFSLSGERKFNITDVCLAAASISVLQALQELRVLFHPPRMNFTPLG
jgi:hypothetical protein